MIPSRDPPRGEYPVRSSDQRPSASSALWNTASGVTAMPPRSSLVSTASSTVTQPSVDIETTRRVATEGHYSEGGVVPRAWTDHP
jgi:hypothetical protein